VTNFVGPAIQLMRMLGANLTLTAEAITDTLLIHRQLDLPLEDEYVFQDWTYYHLRLMANSIKKLQFVLQIT